MKLWKKSVSVLLAALVILAVVTAGVVPGTVRASAASWNGYNYGGGTLYGYQTFLEAFGIDYNAYYKWMDDHDADSADPRYYLGTPYVEWDHRNPHGDCQGAYGDSDIPGVEGMNCTGFVWHVLYKSALASGASSEQISRLRVMWEVPYTWANYGVYRIYFSSIEEAYASGVLEKGDLMWIYGSSDNHNAIFYGKNAKDFIYWDSAGVRNRYSTVHAIGDCLGLWVAKVTQPDYIRLQIDTARGGGEKFGTKYCIFDSKSKAQAALDNPNDMTAWDKRTGTVVLDQYGNGTFRKQSAPTAAELWSGSTPRTDLGYFSSEAKLVSCKNTYYAVQWSAAAGMTKDTAIREFKDSGKRTSTGYRIFSFTSPIKVDTPAVSAVKSVSDGVKLSWKAVSGAEKYRVYVKNSSGGWTRVGETAATSFVDTSAQPGVEYTYTIRCADNAGNFISDFDRTGRTHTYTRIDTPAIASLTSSPEGVTLRWNAVEGAQRYRIYVKNSKGSWTRLTDTDGTEYLHETVTNGATYVYTIRCADTQGDFTSKFNDSGWKHTHTGVDTPVIDSPTAEDEDIRVTWQPVEGAYKYRVYKQINGSWSFIGDTEGTEYTDYAVNSGATCTYTVRCVNQANYFSSDFDRKGKSVTYTGVATPRLDTVTSEPEGIRVTWQPVEGAVRYRVYHKAQGGSWTKVGDTSDTEFFDDTVAFGTTYAYTVRCINSKASGFMSYFDTVGKSGVCKTVATPVFNALISEPEGIRLRWSAVNGAITYRVYCQQTNGGWTRIGETAGTEFFDSAIPLSSSRIYTIRCISSNGRFMSDFNRSGWKGSYHGVATPLIATLESTEDGVRLTWNAVENATTYRVFRLENTGWKGLGNTSDTAFTDASVTAGGDYVYTLRCVGSRGYISGYDNVGRTFTYRPPVSATEEAE